MLNYILVSIKGIKSFDLVLYEQLKLLQPVDLAKPDLVLLKTVAKKTLDLLLQKNCVSLDLVDFRSAGLDLL
jgi:hypothetical protein